jgi:hypothetical protein
MEDKFFFEIKTKWKFCGLSKIELNAKGEKVNWNDVRNSMKTLESEEGIKQILSPYISKWEVDGVWMTEDQREKIEVDFLNTEKTDKQGFEIYELSTQYGEKGKLKSDLLHPLLDAKLTLYIK